MVDNGLDSKNQCANEPCKFLEPVLSAPIKAFSVVVKLSITDEEVLPIDTLSRYICKTSLPVTTVS